MVLFSVGYPILFDGVTEAVYLVRQAYIWKFRELKGR